MDKKNRRYGFLFMLMALIVLLAGSSLTIQASGCDRAKLGAAGAYERGEAVSNLQSCLIESGFGIPAGITGYYGSQTINAVKAFYAVWYGVWNGLKVGPQGITNLKNNSTKPVVVTGSENFKSFASADDFKNYFKKAIQESNGSISYGGSGGGTWTTGSAMAVPSAGMGGASDMMKSESVAVANSVVGRVSETNVQVAGIDEPDIVKTDGKEIYYSPTSPISWWGRGGIMPMATASGSAAKYESGYYYKQPQAKIIKALPVSGMAVDGVLPKSGDMLLSGNVLTVFSNGEVSGFNVADPQNPIQKWSIKPEGNSSIIGSRLYNGKIYMVTRTNIGSSDTCPIRPLSIGGVGITIPCGSIYHPERVLPVNSTFSVFLIDAATGSVEKRTSFAGVGYTSVIYMSADNLYVTYPAYESEFGIYVGLLKEKMADLVPASLIDNINRVSGYDISSSSKMAEFNTLLQDYKNGLSSDDQLKFNNEFQNRLSSYRKARVRNIDRTAIAKIRLSDLGFAASGSVPGQPLNQFSLDEYNGNLRIATTIGSNWFARSETFSDVYVLDGQMNIIGSVSDLGKTEKIYSARFIEDKGYIVTFRQTDPFYVIDLANPRNPKLAGELKIPGYSGYLHPVNKDKIIGIGMENSSVKISYFNVSDPSNPVEMDKYLLDEHWSEAVNNHHAFLMDKQHEIFFMPGGNGGYVFSYENNKLSLAKAVSDINPKRAIYINDYLYMISDSKISVLDENTWEKVKEFEF